MADPRAPKVNGKTNPCCSAASCRLDRITPASTTATRASGRMSRMVFIRSTEMTSAPVASDAPVSPVRPAAGTTGMSASDAARTNADTWAVDAGRATASGSPWALPVTSPAHGAAADPVRRYGSPTISLNVLIKTAPPQKSGATLARMAGLGKPAEMPHPCSIVHPLA